MWILCNFLVVDMCPLVIYMAVDLTQNKYFQYEGFNNASEIKEVNLEMPIQFPERQ